MMPGRRADGVIGSGKRTGLLFPESGNFSQRGQQMLIDAIQMLFFSLNVGCFITNNP